MTFHLMLNINKQVFVIMKNHLESEILKLIIEMDKRQKCEMGVDQIQERNCKKRQNHLRNELNYKVHKKKIDWTKI